MDPTMMSNQRSGGPTTSHTLADTTAILRQSSRTEARGTHPRGLATQWPQHRPGPTAAEQKGRIGHSTPGTTTVLVADPLAASRAGLTAVLTGSGIGRVIEADTVHAVEEIIASGVDGQLALVSLGFGDASYRLIHTLIKGPWQRVIALAPTVDPDPLLTAVRAGASGVLRGRPGTPDEVPGQVHQLTAREIEVLSMVADGRSNKWIAERLSLSSLTIKSHLARISRKLGTGDRSHLVAIALRAGAIS